MKIILSVILIISGILMADIQNRALVGDDGSIQDYTIGTKKVSILETTHDYDLYKFTISKKDGFNIVINMSISNTFKLMTEAQYTNALNKDYYNTIYKKMYYADNLYRWYVSSRAETTASFDLDVGTYYLMAIDSYEESNVNYSFSLSVHGGTSSAPILDNVTKEYCKTNPASCGITAIYTQTQMDVAKVDATTLARTSCKTNPALCGITSLSTLDCNTEAMSNANNTGWNLIGTSIDGCTCELLKSQGAKSVYAYENGEWITRGIIKSHSGFWVKK